MTETSAALLHLLHLVSPALPVGAYAYSQGLESAVEHGWIHDEASAQHWIAQVMQFNLGQLDLPLLQRLYRAWQTDDEAGVEYWNNYLQAARESHELLQEDRQMGVALQRLLADLDVAGAQRWPVTEPTSFATQFALAGQHWRVPLPELLHGYAWSWLENQVAAAIKLVPLGQTQAQQVMLRIMNHIPALVARATGLPDAELGASLPRLAMASMAHETQYSRLFRS